MVKQVSNQFHNAGISSETEGRLFFFNFLFCIVVYPINNIVIVLGKQHVSILP